MMFFFFSSRRRHTRLVSDWSSDVCSSDLDPFRRIPDHLQERKMEPDLRLDFEEKALWPRGPARPPERTAIACGEEQAEARRSGKDRPARAPMTQRRNRNAPGMIAQWQRTDYHPKLRKRRS